MTATKRAYFSHASISLLDSRKLNDKLNVKLQSLYVVIKKVLVASVDGMLYGREKLTAVLTYSF